jgi:SNF2 family DNA or RNA helicase
MATLRKETGIAKIPHIAEFIKMISDDLLIPTVVFGYHREVLKGLKEIFPKSSLVFGGMSTKKRDDEVVKFQEGENNLFLGNIDSASESITLTRSALVVVAEPDWRATALTQAIRRVYRITQTQDCVAYFLAAAKSMDAILTESSFNRLEDFAETFSL